MPIRKKVHISDISWGNTPSGSLAGQGSYLGLNSSGRLVLTEAGSSITTPGSSTDNAIVRFNGTGGSTIQNSAVTIDDSGILSASAITTALLTVDKITGKDIDGTSGTFSGTVSGSSVTGHLVSGSTGTFHEAIVTRLSASSIHIGTNDDGADRQITFGDSGTGKTVIGVDNSLNEFVINRNVQAIPTSQASAGPDFTIQLGEVNIGNGNSLRIGGEASATDGTDRVISFNHSTNPSAIGIDDSQDAFCITVGGNTFGNTNTMEIHSNGEMQYNGKVQIDGNGASWGGGSYGGTNALGVFHGGSDGNNGIMITRGDTSTADGDLLGGIGFDSVDGNSPSSVLEAAAFIAAYAAEDHSSGDKGGDLVFGTTTINDDDDTASHEWMRITDTGNVGIGTNDPKNPLDIYEMGGLILGYTMLNNNDGATNGLYQMTTGYVVPNANWKITFTAPKSGKVEIQFLGYLASAAAGNDYVYLGLSDNSTYNSLGNQYQREICEPDEDDNLMLTTSWYLTGLTAGTSYTYYIGTKGTSTAHYWKWGGTNSDENPPIIIRAISLPNTIHTD